MSTRRPRQKLELQGDVESALPPLILQPSQLVGHKRRRRERTQDLHNWGPHDGQDSPGCLQMTSLQQNLKIRINTGIDLIL